MIRTQHLSEWKRHSLFTQNTNHIYSWKMTTLPPIPKGFLASMQELLGKDEAESLLQAIEQKPSIAIRLHPRKGMTNLIQCGLPYSEIYGEPYNRVPWYSRFGIYPPRQALFFTADPLFHGAAYYVQEASSMALSLIRPLLGESPIAALDLCAAPGGKQPCWRILCPKALLWLRMSCLESGGRSCREYAQVGIFQRESYHSRRAFGLEQNRTRPSI